MPDSEHEDTTPRAALLLKGAGLLFTGLGIGFLVWLGEKWAEYPEMRASQFGYDAPLWPALGVFTLVAMGAVVGLFWSAARRVERGEDLFAQRHRRSVSEWRGNENGSRTN